MCLLVGDQAADFHLHREHHVTVLACDAELFCWKTINSAPAAAAKLVDLYDDPYDDDKQRSIACMVLKMGCIRIAVLNSLAS